MNFNWPENLRFPVPILHRRLAPPAMSLLSLGIMIYPILTDRISEYEWLKSSLLILAILFTFKAALFAWMRQTMVIKTRKLTTFGFSLVDFFTAIVIGDFFLVYLFLAGWWALQQGQTQASFSSKVIGRSGLVAASIFVISTGVAVGYEMWRARGHMSVHEDGLDWRSPKLRGEKDGI